jgi:hypothetical protein
MQKHRFLISDLLQQGASFGKADLRIAESGTPAVNFTDTLPSMG